MKKKSEVENLLLKKNWHKERKKLRSLILDCDLDEEVKWGKLCYSYQDSNVVIIYGMKNYCALGFFKGSLLDDDTGFLVQPGKHSQAMRQLRFDNLDEISDSEDLIKDYIGKAIQAERDGLEVDFDEKDNLTYPDELQDVLDDDPEFAEAFDDLTPGRQRGYVLHFSDAKRSTTRSSRIEKCTAKILDGKGLNER
ncbi:YdeI family protein [Pararhizobium sp. IMCC21322]|uniref:YdeI/OmpD-associated family protein n=1 Tax=Pararhizobium sp. IMCC21322 TaxID=3067903 RepID=UPI0027419663|nr:DUF1801 domain-containing protein [Pararhizobium sp. IMCC21322]